MLSPLPSYGFRTKLPNLWDMARHGVSDFARVIPEAILHEPAVQLPGGPLVVAEPALIREVLNDREQRFTRDRLLRRLLRRAWGGGIAGAEGEEWQRQRRAASPAFRPNAVEQNSPLFAAAAERMVRAWPVGERIELTQQLALIVAEIVFSVLIDAAGEVDTAAVAKDIPTYIRRIAAFSILDMVPLPESWHDKIAGIDGDPSVRRLRVLAKKLAFARKQKDAKNDLLTKLEGIGPVEDNVLGLFPAAMDTTVAGISWTLYTLALRPNWQSRVAEEARSNKDNLSLDKLPVTRRVVQEVLRLYPPGPFSLRSAAADGELGGFRLREGQPVSLSFYAMHRHRTLWESPDEFEPDRFLAGQSAPSAWMPFGAGPRVCIAAQFALTEITVIVARLLAELEFVPTGPTPSVTLQVTTRSATGLGAIAKHRI